MAYKQIRAFDPQKMGTRKGYCLMNVRLGFGIDRGTYPSAKADMEAQKKAGTFHAGQLPPTNIAAPVYFDTSSIYEHVMGDDHGIFYSDGKRLTSIAGWTVLGWGECCDGVRVVEFVPDPPQPQPTPGFLPAKGFWAPGDNDARVGQLASFMRANFPRYTPAKALGNYYGPYLTTSIKVFQQRAKSDGRYNGAIDGKTGPLTYAALKSYGFKG
jgi:hypothetical protein